MFAEWRRVQEGRAVARQNALKGAQKRREEAAALERQAEQLSPVPPSARLLEHAAYLCHCADIGAAPSVAHSHAVQGRGGRPYRVHAMTLRAALADALALGWVGQSPSGGLFWRDGADLETLGKLWESSGNAD